MSGPLAVVAGVALRFHREPDGPLRPTDFRGAQVLACRRAPSTSGAGQWEFPGGKVEPGESPEQALARELWEELACRVTVGSLFLRATTGPIDLACYLVSGLDPVASTDHDQLRWVPLAEIAHLDWAAADIPAVLSLTELHLVAQHS